MSEARTALALAAIDPDAALAAASIVDDEPPPAIAVSAPVVMAIEAPVPAKLQRWRWFVAYWIIRLAAKIYGFKVEFYRPPHPWES